MSKQVRLQQMYNVMEEMLNSGGTVNFNPRGYSMCPTLRNDGDRVVIKKINSLKKYDLPLYIRPDGSFVLHRVISVNKDGTYSDARVLTVYEIMRLFTIPDNWNIPIWANDNFIRRVIGEGIPPLLIYKIVRNLDGDNNE